MTLASPRAMLAPSANTMIAPSSPVLFRLVSDHPATLQSDGPTQATSTHSSDVERSEPIHITSLITTLDGATSSAKTERLCHPRMQTITLAGKRSRRRAGRKCTAHHCTGKETPRGDARRNDHVAVTVFPLPDQLIDVPTGSGTGASSGRRSQGSCPLIM